MSLTDELFMPALAVIVALYYFLPLVVRSYILLLSSLLFYVTWGPEKLPFILAACLVAWAAALLIGKAQAAAQQEAKEAKERGEKPIRRKGRPGRALMWLAVLLLGGALIYTKAGRRWGNTSIIVPLGVSYYTFALVGYVVDVYYGRVKADRNYFMVLSFASFFPGILQGPIARYNQLAPQLREGHRIDYQKFCFGLQLAIYGLFKKLVIADRLALYSNTVFQGDNFKNYSGVVIFVGFLIRSIQLYCDFSGYMDIAGGVAQLFGIDLAKNFNHPFFARSASDFWRRWHITLGIWFKDFVYMPLMVSPTVSKISQWVKNLFGKRAGKSMMTIIPVYVVWILTGLWHGTGWNYVIWGVYWGTIIAFSTVYAPEIRKLNKWLHINTEAESWKVFQMVRTFLLFTVGRVITLDNAVAVLKQMVKSPKIGQLFDGTMYTLGMDRPNFILAVVAIGVVWFISLKQEKYSVREKIASFNIVFRWLIYYLAILSVVIFGIYGLSYDASSFIYMQF